ncbi:alpha-L-fucosidase [Labedella gwakjiensis]|uniref:alpha-L-fucosidase n=1 Tax=Labedella gwakjiensis TaxID=390269 RepID=A0A2P8GU80_9MICO|nr:alpha-L-fucosidase [Labedella gwakjiensis]PSL37520.1 alpha-L-fucosidase [Labedella gwakjiensis]RUQ84821.1 alpha-L-fucosidase [Labedella gwakjiensis]
MTRFDTPLHRSRLAEIDRTIAEGPLDASWDALQTTAPDWYVDGKFGIFIHWGPYAVPAFGSEWYPRNMYIEGTPEFEHHRATYGDQSEFGYKDFIPSFTADSFDAAEWARIFRRAGAQFVVPVAEHHDGFPLYDCSFTRWKATEMGPKRDVIGELSEAVRAQSMVFGASSHRAEHWFFFNGGARFDSDVTQTESLDLYGPAQREESEPTTEYLEDWLVRTTELVDLYRPQLVWFDWWIERPSFAPYLKRFLAYYYTRALEWGRPVAVNYKYDALPAGTGVFDVERGQLAETRADFWQTDTSVSKNSWSYVENHDYKQADDLIADLVDIVSKNGALLLNVGPKADGTIPEAEVELLETIGAWLSRNGEAIYGTRPWTIAGEGPTAVTEGAFTDTAREPFTAEDIRFTSARDHVYATVLAPAGETVRIRSLGSSTGLLPRDIESVALLGHAGEVTWRREPDALVIDVPSEAVGTLTSFRVTPLVPATRPRRIDIVGLGD